MPTDTRPLRDVLREVEEAMRLQGGETVYIPRAYSRTHLGTLATASVRLARELRALAPLLRKAIEAMDWADRDTRETLDLMADELEAH